METFFIILLSVLLAVSVFFNVRFYQWMRHFEQAFIRERRAHNVDNLLSALACVASLALVWLSKPRE